MRWWSMMKMRRLPRFERRFNTGSVHIVGMGRDDISCTDKITELFTIMRDSGHEGSVSIKGPKLEEIISIDGYSDGSDGRSGRRCFLIGEEVIFVIMFEVVDGVPRRTHSSNKYLRR